MPQPKSLQGGQGGQGEAAEDEDSFSLLKNIPLDICHQNIFPFLDGMALSTLHLAVSVDRNEKAVEVMAMIQKSAQDRVKLVEASWQSDLDELATRFSSSSSAVRHNPRGGRDPVAQIRPFIFRSLNFIHELLQQEATTDQDSTRSISDQSRRISDAMILEHTFSFPYHKLGISSSLNNNICGEEPAHSLTPEWPIWCGQIEVSYANDAGLTNVMMTANVILLTPNFDPIHFLGWSTLSQKRTDGNSQQQQQQQQQQPEESSTDFIQLRAESYNSLPTPPMGRLVGITEADRGVLNRVSHRLSFQDTVAILSPFHRSVASRTRCIDSVRIMSRPRAQERIRSMPSLPFSFYVEGTTANASTGNADPPLPDQDSELLCCWQYRDLFDETTANMTARDCVPYWKQLVEMRDRCLAERSNNTDALLVDQEEDA